MDKRYTDLLELLEIVQQEHDEELPVYDITPYEKCSVLKDVPIIMDTLTTCNL